MATSKELLAVAAKQIGVRESPPNSNNVCYNTWYYGREVSGKGFPWCMVFVQWVFDQAKVKLPRRTASCGDMMRAAKAAGRWVTKDYRPGDVAIYDFPGGAATDHCGIVSKVLGDRVYSIEGNTGTTSDADGGQVMERVRYNKYIVGAMRPEYDEESEENMDKETFAKHMNEYLADLEAQGPASWSAAERAWAEKIGLIKGDDKGRKKYKAFPTREELVVIFYRFAKWLGKA